MVDGSTTGVVYTVHPGAGGELDLLDRPFCERSIICFTLVSFFLFFPTHFFRRLQTDIFETFPHDVAILEKEALLCRFHKSAP